MTRQPTEEQIKNARSPEWARTTRQWCDYNFLAHHKARGKDIWLTPEQDALQVELDELNHDWSFRGLDNDQLDAALTSLRTAWRRARMFRQTACIQVLTAHGVSA